MSSVAQAERLPLRDRVEIVIKKGEEFLLILSASPVTFPDWRGFPGGGVDGNTPEKACEQECLEEVGIKVKNIRPLGVHFKESYVSGKGSRKEEFRGSKTSWYVAEYDGEDHSMLGSDGDAKKYEWVNYNTAKQRLMASGGPRVPSQLTAMTKCK